MTMSQYTVRPTHVTAGAWLRGKGPYEEYDGPRGVGVYLTFRDDGVLEVANYGSRAPLVAEKMKFPIEALKEKKDALSRVFKEPPPQLTGEQIRKACERGAISVANCQFFSVVHTGATQEEKGLVVDGPREVEQGGEWRRREREERAEGVDILIEHAWVYDCRERTLTRHLLVSVAITRNAGDVVEEYSLFSCKQLEAIPPDSLEHPLNR